MPGAKLRPFGKRFLHSAFAEAALAGRDQRFDRLGGPGLANGDELDLGRIAGATHAALAIGSRICRRRSSRAGHRGSELEGSADVDGLAVAPLILQRRHLVALDLVADAAGQSEALR